MTIQYTTKCAGDLGLKTSSGRVVTLLFLRGDGDPIRFSVADVVIGGLPTVFETLRGADEAMWEIGRREEAKDNNISTWDSASKEKLDAQR